MQKRAAGLPRHGFELLPVLSQDVDLVDPAPKWQAGKVTILWETDRVSSYRAQNNLHELWALLNVLYPEVLSSSLVFDDSFKIAALYQVRSSAWTPCLTASGSLSAALQAFMVLFRLLFVR